MPGSLREQQNKGGQMLQTKTPTMAGGAYKGIEVAVFVNNVHFLSTHDKAKV